MRNIAIFLDFAVSDIAIFLAFAALDIAIFHQRKGEERDFPQGNAEGRDSGARESWLEDERARWMICVSVGRLDACATLCFPYVVCGQRSLWVFGEVFEEFREWEFQTRTTASTRRSVSVVRFPSCFGLISARYVRAPFPFLFVAQA